MRRENIEVPRQNVVLLLWMYAITTGGAIAFLVSFIRPIAPFPLLVALVSWLTQLVINPAVALWRACVAEESSGRTGFGFFRWAMTATAVSAVVFLALRLIHAG